MARESEQTDPGPQKTPLNRFSNFRYHSAHSTADDEQKLPDGSRKCEASSDHGRQKSHRGRSKRRSDMEVRAPGNVSNLTPTQGVRSASGPAAANKTPLEVPQDEVELSSANQVTGKQTEATEATLRAERLARIKAEIDAGTYDTDAKLEAAMLKMFDRHGIDLEA